MSFDQIDALVLRRRRSQARVVLGLALAVSVIATVTGGVGTARAGSLTLPSSGSFLYMDSEPGDYIGGGIEQLYTAADSTINGSLSADGRSSWRRSSKGRTHTGGT
jgi:hypothetical protein